MIGGLLNVLGGQSDYTARAARPDTRAGERAIALQRQQGVAAARAGAYSLAASARGASAPLALREAQRRGVQGAQGVEASGLQAQAQLQQAAANQYAANQMQAQQINAQTAQANAGGLQKLAGLGLGAGMLALSDARAKEIAYQQGAQAQQARSIPATGYGATGPGLSGTDYGFTHADLRAQLQANREAEQERANAEAAGVPWPPAAAPVAAAPAALPAAPAAPARPSFGDALGQGLVDQYVQSDARAKVLEDDNRALRDALADLRSQLAPPPPRDTGGAAPSPAPQMRRIMGRMQMPINRAAQTRAQSNDVIAPIYDAYGREVGSKTTSSIPLSEEEQRRLEILAMRPQLSDERAKMVFPSGVKPVAYHYRPGMGDGDPSMHYGVLAQDLERSPEGASTVEEDPRTGLKMVDTGKLSMVNTAALAELNRRLRRLEKDR